jgi:NAD(P)-dependent dehydrogenase (short-subunit alcohol dehydrogenase family)
MQFVSDNHSTASPLSWASTQAESEIHMPTWFITGASSGFGRILTERLLERGDTVGATVRRPEALEDLKKRHGERLWIATLDMTDAEGVKTTVERAFADLGRIDVVVSNAGYGVLGAAEEADLATVRHLIDTNLLGSIELIRAAVPRLREQGGGRVLQFSSEGGQLAYPGFSLYHATKWGIEGFVEAIAQETAPFGIEFTLIEPGPTATGFAASVVRPSPQPAYAGTPADAVRKAIDSGAFAITGNAAKGVDAMLAMIDRGEAPLRLTLGGTAYESIRAALTRRLAELETQKALAYSADDAAGPEG